MFLKTVLIRTLHRPKKLLNFTPILIKNYHDRYTENGNHSKYGKILATALFSSVIIGSALKELEADHSLLNSEVKAQHIANVNSKDGCGDGGKFEAGAVNPDLPTYSAEEVSKHDTEEDMWVIFRRGVYDVTSFAESHPGGEQIYNAAGSSIEPFWNVYGAHHTEDVYRLLETFRIGNLCESDVVDHSDEELWACEPRRDPRLLVRTPRPFNAETPPEVQVDYFDTPNELFFVRQHMPVPQLCKDHKVTVSWCGKQKVLTLEELKKLPQANVRAALACAGNRRAHMNQVKPSKGIAWETGAISNAIWSGVYLRDVLLHCGVDINDSDGKHVILEGADTDATGKKFSTSIPLWLAVQPAHQLLVALRMNGAPLPPDHGAPVRLIVPGAPAVRSVKWLESIKISQEESDSHWHRQDYRSLNPSQAWDAICEAPPIYSLPVTSAICKPKHGDTYKVHGGCVIVQGYAYSGGGAAIARVEVSTDGGSCWQAAALCRDAAPPRAHYSWSLWSARLPVTRDMDQLEIWVKATDSNFNTQPEKFDDIWNVRGLLANAYHKITINLDHCENSCC